MGAGTPLGSRAFTLPRLALVFAALVALYLFRDLWLPSMHPDWRLQSHSQTPEKPISQATTSSIACKDVPGADKVMVMLKTGATELYQKLPTHFMTTFQCVPNFMIYSDAKQYFADQPVYDAIAPVSPSIRKEHDDFELYREIAKWRREGQDLSKLRGGGGWNLDKWKFLPMLHQTFNTASADIEWFIMIEADTSLSWTNLLQWLKTMDPTKPYYLGAQNAIGGVNFAHGGSGIVISRAAADRLKQARDELGHEKYDQAWEEATSQSCCGDEIVARAFSRVDVNLTAAWPLIQGETVNSVDWTPSHWCTPSVTWHHVTPIEVDTLWQFESEWIRAHGVHEPYLFRDVFARFIEPHISVNRTNWNNHSKDRKFVSPAAAVDGEESDNKDKWDTLAYWEQAAVESEEACAAACQQSGPQNCIQWMFTPGRCYLGKDIRFGHSDEHEDEHFTSGWMHDRVRDFRGELEGCKVRWTG